MTETARRIVELRYEDEALARLDLPGGPMEVLRGVGSGLCTDVKSRVWGVGDRGPNLKVGLAVERYGLTALARHSGLDGAKVMPCPEIGPAISELAVEGDRVVIVRTFPIRDRDGRPLSGFPTPGGEHSVAEPAITPDGEAIPPDPSGADSEGIAPAGDGGFWVGDEYGPSLLRIAADGEVIARWVPEGCEALFEGARYPVLGVLPAIAAQRRLNRGFEALAASPDGRSILLAFQSPLSHPDEEAHRRGRHVRLWRLDAETGAVEAEWLYPLDAPDAFRRDAALGPVERSDVKVSELAVIGPDRLLVLERASATTKLYAVELSADRANDPAHLDPATRPTVEELSAGDAFALPVLEKRLVLDGDAAPELGPDLEGIAFLPDGSLLIVNDNDFGVEGVRTRFWRVEGLSLAPDRPVEAG